MNEVAVIEDASPEDSHLTVLIHAFDWAGVLARIVVAPDEISTRGPQGRLPLHVAVDHDAPAVVVQALISAYPEGSKLVGSSNMNPLHITVSSQHASVHTVRVLLELGYPEQLEMQDIDGDTPLHAACRAGAPIEVIEVLLRAYPQAVHVLDNEGLPPIFRLWIRCYIIVGEEKIKSIRTEADLDGEMREVWSKTELLLKCAKFGNISDSESPFRILHAAASVDCPRAVVEIAAHVYTNQLEERDPSQGNQYPLHMAAKAPVYQDRDLNDPGEGLDDDDDGEFHDLEDQVRQTVKRDKALSVIDILLEASENAADAIVRIPEEGSNRLPLHLALVAHKTWNDGVHGLVTRYSESLSERDPIQKLPAFLLAAVGDQADTSTIYELIRWNPNALDSLLSLNMSQ